MYFSTIFLVALWYLLLDKCFHFYSYDVLNISVICIKGYFLVDAHSNNDRYIKLTFVNGAVTSMLHGFAGYFDALLYDSVSLSELFTH